MIVLAYIHYDQAPCWLGEIRFVRCNLLDVIGCLGMSAVGNKEILSISKKILYIFLDILSIYVFPAAHIVICQNTMEKIHGIVNY